MVPPGISMLLMYLSCVSVSNDHELDDDVLIKERLEDDDFISRFDEAHKGTQHAFIGTGGDGDFGIGVDLLAEEGRVGIRNGLLQTRAALVIVSNADAADHV